MVTLTEQLSDFYTIRDAKIPADVSATLNSIQAEHSASFDFSKAVKAGDKHPRLQTQRHSRQGRHPQHHPTVANGAPPPCNLELRALKKLLPEFAAKGTTLIAVSPALPDQAIVTSQKNEITFPILSDVRNGLATQLNIVFKQPERIKDFWALRGGVDWQARYGDESLEVPVPGTILVDKTGTIHNVHIDPNWRKRLESTTVLTWIDEL
ncbi:hypothetical protein M422DRAFT_255139 [Sphaerobolus stellatus SS14]|uniref:Alkyl hydroperoxide reductase subunit C/ Thiol specific antioxidant domain-containing protein n=1 Tax=Sphaerobolus stellatus (strain SS14) TaxID=990650 RepID=A0A0C9VTE9_SPHS4|nr:hypothetical protein M422DRAFT_255139 [Sphaerobolus stellatus SS14]